MFYNLLGTTKQEFEIGTGGSYFLKFKKNPSITLNMLLTFPANLGSANDFLKTDGSGNLSWANPALTSGAFAEIYTDNNTTAQTIPTGTAFTKITQFTANGLSKNATSDYTNNKLTITRTGIYKVNGSFSFYISRNGVCCCMQAFLNGNAVTGCHFVSYLATSNAIQTAFFTGLINATSTPWDLDVRARHDNGASVDFTVQFANLNILYLGAST